MANREAEDIKLPDQVDIIVRNVEAIIKSLIVNNNPVNFRII